MMRCFTHGTELCPNPECRSEAEGPVAKSVRLERELAESKAETAAMLLFLDTELSWEWFRAEGMLGPEPVTVSEQNARKISKFLSETGHAQRFMAEVATLREQLEAALHTRKDQVTCAFCGAVSQLPTTLEDIAAHVEVCEKHPLAAAKADIEVLRATVKLLAGKLDALDLPMWRCSRRGTFTNDCTAHNAGWRTECHKCKHPRP